MRDGIRFGLGGRGRPGLIAVLDGFTEKVEETLDRVAGAVERGVAGLERRVEQAVGADGPGRGGKPAPAAADASSRPEEGRTRPEDTPGAEPEANPRAGAAGRFARGYAEVVDRTREGVSAAVGRGAEALDGAVGDAPWRMAGLDARRTRIAREVMLGVVPRVAGERVASVIDGAALKGGVAGAGLLLRVPLKGFAVPFLLGVTAVETVRAVRDVRRSVADVAARVDNEGRSREAYRTGS